MDKEARIIDGRSHANKLLDSLRKNIDFQKRKNNLTAKLAIILVGVNKASAIYVRNKINTAQKIGIETTLLSFDETVSEKILLNTIDRMNTDKTVSGIIVQLPLPNHISKEKIIISVDPKKDVDGLHPMNVGLLNGGYSGGFIPCTARGVLELIKITQLNIAGKKIVILGRSNIVGKPLVALLSQYDATVTLCHSKTTDLISITSDADIVISAIGKPKFLTEEYFSPNSIAIDVGINRLALDDNDELSGDIDFNTVKYKVKYITPVPGGVGPMTISYLLINTFEAMIRNNNG